MASDSTFLTRVSIKNYRSIRACSVNLRPLNFLVGPNGAGKSNFLDALRFVADALNTTLDHAIRDRGGIDEVRRRSGGHPTHFGVRLDFRLSEASFGHYAFTIGARPRGAFEVQEEECAIQEIMGTKHHFKLSRGEVVEAGGEANPAASADRLYLVAVSGAPQFRKIFDALSHMGFYNLNPGEIRDLQSPDAGELLIRDGGNLASVLGELAVHEPDVKRRIEEYLERVTPGIKGVDRKSLGPKQTLEFRQEVAGSSHPWKFPAASMSDGTLRALGILAALFQSRNDSVVPIPLVGIEEPEVALHPAAAGVLLAALREAAMRVQVIVTSHSPDLLDSEDIPTEALLAVRAQAGVTTIGPIDEAGRQALMKRLFTPGELLRLDQLAPEVSATGTIENPRLFGPRDS